MTTGMFLGLSARDCGNFDGYGQDDEGGWSLEDRSAQRQRKRRPHQLTLIGPDEAAKDVTAFFFSKANVSGSFLAKSISHDCMLELVHKGFPHDRWVWFGRSFVLTSFSILRGGCQSGYHNTCSYKMSGS